MLRNLPGRAATCAALKRLVASDRRLREKLARALFEKEESILPEGDTWDSIDDGDKSYFDKCALAVCDVLIEALWGD